MKKIYSLFFVCLIFIGLCSCGKSESATDYKLGLGFVGYEGPLSDGKAQFEATVAAVVTDGNGKIVACKIDALENAVNVTDGVIDKQNTSFLTKQELGDEYGMKEYSPIKKEWYEQANFFADYVIGMTANEVLKIKTTEKDGKKIASEDIIASGCTVDISEFIAAVIEGCDDPKAKKFKAASYNLGLGIDTVLSEDSKDGEKVQFDINISAAVTDKSGKVISMVTDAVEPEIEFDDDDIEKVLTKREIGNDYGMKKHSPIKKEWYEQADAYSDYVIGLDVTGVKGVKPDDEYLSAGCTIAIDGMTRSAVKAIDNSVK